jgi:hypothetical protein
MKITVENTETGPKYQCDGQPITWREVRDETGLDRSLSRLLLKKLAQSGEDVEDLRTWRDRNVLIWKLENEFRASA